MLIAGFPSGPWQANCYVVSGDGRRCVVIDPGMGAAAEVERIVGERGLTVEGVLLTHGHIDHVADAAAVADAHGVPAWLHAADRELLTDPGPGIRQALAPLFGALDLREPADLRLLAGGETVDVAGLAFRVVHAPGHRPGCVLFRLPLADSAPLTEVVFTGDVVFAGSIGRTDLPGGDPDAMVTTLAGVVLGLPDTAALLPGHGGQSTMARERADNPYLQPSFLR